MKNIKILYWCVLLLLIVLLFFSIMGFYVTIMNWEDFVSMFSITPLGPYSRLAQDLFMVLLVISLFKAQKGLRLILKQGSFNTKSGKLIKQCGHYIMAYAIGYLIIQINFIEMNDVEEIAQNIATNLAVLLVGFTFSSFSKIIKDGELIKQENDLTI